MATKDCYLFLKKENNGIYNNGTQYTNVNLNKFQKSEEYKPLQSDSCLLSSNLQACRLNESTLAAKKETLWKKRGDVSTMFEKLHVGEKEGQPRKTNVAENLNSSTLSLHIAAYETAIEEAQNGRKDGSKKTKKDVKSVFNAPTFRDVFDFPRQQEGQVTKPEVMQFKTSQTMKNPSKSEAMTTKLLDVVDEISMLFERKEIGKEEFISRLNGRREEIGYATSTDVFHCWQKRVGNAESRYINNGMRARDDVDSRIISIQRKFNPNFCTSNLILHQNRNDTTTAEAPEQSIRVSENMGASENHDDRIGSRRVILGASGNNRFRVGRTREILLSEEQKLQAVRAAEAVSKRYQKGFTLVLEGFFRYNRDVYRAWNYVLEECKEKSHNIGTVWTELDKQIFAIESRMNSDTSEWGPLARLNQSPTTVVIDKSSSKMPESSHTPLVNGANLTHSSLETSASKRKLTEADTVPSKKRSSTLLNGNNQNSSRTSPIFSVATVPSHEQSRNHAATQGSTKQANAEVRQTHPSLNLQSSNQQHSTAESSQALSNSPNNDTAAASPPPQIQEAQQSHMPKQIVQISTTMKYGAHRLQNFKLASICSGNIPVIQVLLPKNLDIHMCRGIGEDLSHRTKAFRPRVTAHTHQQSTQQSVVGIRMLADFSILNMDDEDDKNQKIVCLGVDQKPVAVISLPSEFTIYETWMDDTIKMIDIPLASDEIF